MTTQKSSTNPASSLNNEAGEAADKSKTHDHFNSEETHPFARPFLWVLSKRCQALTLYVLLILTSLSILLTLIKPLKIHLPHADWPGFFALYGFLAFSFVVLAGWPLGKLLRRKENYYQENDEK